MTETEILRILFPPEGAIPLDRIDILPQIRGHISTIITLATGSHPDTEESRAITLKIVELREAGAGSWTEIAKQMGLGMTGSACRHRYNNYRKAHPVMEYQENAHEATEQAQVHHLYTAGPSPGYEAIEVKTSSNHSPADAIQTGYSINPDLDSSGDFSAARIETASEVEKNSEEVPTIRKSRTVEGDDTRPTKADLTPCQRGQLIGPKIPYELDDELIQLREEGKPLAEIVGLLHSRGVACNQADVSARVITEQRKRAKETEKPEPVSISRKELDLMMWDLWKAGKTLDEISEILYSEGLYYSPKSVRVRLLSQGATL